MMTKWIVGLAASLTLAFALVSPAAAQPFDGQAWSLYRIAVAYWGKEPPLCTSLRAELVSPPLLHEAGERYSGAATQPTESTGCEILIAENLSRLEECAMMVHEVGHLEGYGHSSNPASPMYPAGNPNLLVCFGSHPVLVRDLAWHRLWCPAYAGQRWVHCWQVARHIRERLRSALKAR